MSDPIGVRLNNPCCLEHRHGDPSVLYRGEIHSSDPVYRQFCDAPHGFRATVELLRAYYRRDGVRTVREAIERFSPPSDGNPTALYAANVADACKLDMDAPADFEALWFPMLTAMSNQECGHGWFTGAQISLGIDLAGPAEVSHET